MRDPTGSARRIAAAAVAALAMALAAPPARAHGLRLWVQVDQGRTIKGRAYFPGGGRAKGVRVDVLGPGERKLGETKTDENGEFTWEASRRSDHTFVVETADGHRDTAIVKAADLPPNLPPPEGGAAGDSPAALVPGAGNPPATVGATPRLRPSDRAELERAIDAVVSRRIRPLSEKLEAYEDRRRLADVLGGIGYILGLAGLVFYFKASARKRAHRRGPDG